MANHALTPFHMLFLSLCICSAGQLPLLGADNSTTMRSTYHIHVSHQNE
jgi:hypothetical protein